MKPVRFSFNVGDIKMLFSLPVRRGDIFYVENFIFPFYVFYIARLVAYLQMLRAGIYFVGNKQSEGKCLLIYEISSFYGLPAFSCIF
jgi:hypothetical protein